MTGPRSYTTDFLWGTAHVRDTWYFIVIMQALQVHIFLGLLIWNVCLNIRGSFPLSFITTNNIQKKRERAHRWLFSDLFISLLKNKITPRMGITAGTVQERAFTGGRKHKEDAMFSIVSPETAVSVKY